MVELNDDFSNLSEYRKKFIIIEIITLIKPDRVLILVKTT